MSRPGNMWRKVHGHITGRPTNFSWVVRGEVAGSGLPMAREEFDWMLRQGVRSVVSTTEDALPPQWTGDVEYLHIPTPDMTAPRPEDIDAATDFMRRAVLDGRPVVVHCAAGLGRTGTVLACYAVRYDGKTASEAIRDIRSARPGSIQSDVQEQAVFMYEKRL